MSEMIVFDLQGCCGGAMLPIDRLPIFLNKGWVDLEFGYLF